LRLLNRLLVLLFVSRKAQAHACTVLDGKRARRKIDASPAQPATAAASAIASPDPTMPTAAPTAAAGKPAAAVAALESPREALIRDALAARKARESEWNALSPDQKRRAIAGLGEGMAAIVKTFRAA
jgi:hypothetical protein